VSVELMPKEAGEFPFACPMAMFRGRLIVEWRQTAVLRAKNVRTVVPLFCSEERGLFAVTELVSFSNL
jgi:plastocyanin domain-containing protein